ncbi:MAG TPA: 4Fe-4S dicluster domain-containing protein [Solirubrobacteraceae bacterium]|nr:4Fe-4S dicluster domain-containing protein [Solirubrobacteraceae bacterium]
MSVQGAPLTIDRPGLDELLGALRRRGYTVIGPQVRSGSIVYDELRGTDELPAGWVDEQEGGTFRLRDRGDGALFAHAVGHDSLKRFLFPPVLTVWRARRDPGGGLAVEAPGPPPRYAFVGVRSCDLHAVAIQDRVFLGDRFVDEDYEARRRDALFIAVNCSRAGGTCFCASMGTGPRVSGGHDLALTEIVDDGGHRFLVEVGSQRGAELLADVPARPADGGEQAAAEAAVERTRASMGRTLDTTDIRELLQANADHPRWDEVADRCLSCGNCTMVCPTCFCSSAEDTTDLAGDEAVHTRVWDSCFTLEHSYVHGGSVRRSGRSRYRQWMTHKLSTWIDQFGTSGCVGCGRCITWCPVAIDITEETAAIRATDGRRAADADG